MAASQLSRWAMSCGAVALVDTLETGGRITARGRDIHAPAYDNRAYALVERRETRPGRARRLDRRCR